MSLLDVVKLFLAYLTWGFYHADISNNHLLIKSDYSMMKKCIVGGLGIF